MLKKTNHCAIRSDHEWMRQTKETQPTVWGRRLRWNIPANRTEARWMEWILWNWIRACKSLGVEKRSIDQISNSNQGLFQCDAPGIWRQGRQSTRSRVIRRGIAGISEVCSVKLPVSSRASLTIPLHVNSKPVYGLIFLFRWREDDPEKQEPSCPEGLWFANQVSGFGTR